MDPTRFDSLIRVLANSQTRRRLLGRSLSAALAGVTGAHHVERAAAKHCKAVGQRCQKDRHCCSGSCEASTRQCVSACDVAEGTCGTLTTCAQGCSCYLSAFADERVVCLRDPADPPTCAGLQLCNDSDDECPRGYLCTASSCCGADAVCLPLCAARTG